MTADGVGGGKLDVVAGALSAILLHGAAAWLLLASRGTAEAPAIRYVQMRTFMVAAPKGDVSVGVVQAPPPVEAAPAPRAAVRVPEQTKSAPATTKTRPRNEPKLATVTPNAAKSATNAPTAGSEAGGAGSDLANVDLGGTEFPFPAYQRNIINRIAEQFRTTQRSLSAEVMFIIRRDGSVDVDQMKLLTRSGNYAFDNTAMGAIEAAANKRLFGPLPAEFKNDALTVIFKFDPSLSRP